MYQMGLGKKLDRLKEEYNRCPSTIKGQEKLSILEFEMKEIKLRLDYIK
jgi:hypothetical protein